jgi:hypothetical protein
MFSFPFANFILNLGAETDGHIDPMDDGLCTVVPFGDWQGGELCLAQPGLVFQLRSGDFVSFPSDEIAHFNLRMSGLRGSIVLSTDRTMKGWVENRNEWSTHVN